MDAIGMTEAKWKNRQVKVSMAPGRQRRFWRVVLVRWRCKNRRAISTTEIMLEWFI